MRMTKDIHWLGQRLGRGLADAVGPGGLTVTQMIALDALHALPGANHQAIVNATMIDRSTVSDVLRRLQGGGYVTRTISKEDARNFVCEMTHEGRKLFLAQRPKLVAVEKGLIKEAKALASDW